MVSHFHHTGKKTELREVRLQSPKEGKKDKEPGSVLQEVRKPGFRSRKATPQRLVPPPLHSTTILMDTAQEAKDGVVTKKQALLASILRD